MDAGERVIYFAETDYRNKRQRFGIKEKDRSRHTYVIGKTGMGKSTLLENMAIQDIQNGSGLAFIDPHGGSAEALLDYVPASRLKDVMYFAPFDMDWPISFNIMEDVGPDKRHLVVNGLMSTFEKIWADAWSARMAYILQNTLLALLEYPGATLLGVNRMLTDKPFREKVVANIADPAVKSFWVDEFARYTDRYAAEATPAIQNKVGQFSSNPLIRNIIGQPKSSFDLRQMMDEKKIIIVNLSKGRVGEGNAKLLGGMFITKVYLSAMSRADKTKQELVSTPPFNLYVDEFQSFANRSFADILSEARKYNLTLTIAHQYVEQMEEEVRDAVFGNVGTTVAFRVGPLDAELLEKVFAPKFTIEDLVNLGRNQIYLSLMIDGVGSTPFSAQTLPPLPRPPTSLKTEVIDNSRHGFAEPRAKVEKLIKEWHEEVDHGQTPRPQYQSPRPTQSFAPRPSPRPAPVQTPSPRVPIQSRPPVQNTNSNNSNNSSKNWSPRPPKPVIPREAMEALGSSNLKSLLQDAMKDLPVIDEEERVYKPDEPAPDLSAEAKVEADVDNSGSQAQIDTLPSPKKELPTSELKKIFE